MNDAVTILVVEDDQLIQAMVKEALSDGGFASALAASGEEAITLLQDDKSKYRAVVTDINLRGKLDGWEVGRSARETDPTMPIIYMTGTHGEEWASKGVPNSLLLAKPFAPAQIVIAISQLLNATHRSRPQCNERGLMARKLKTCQISLGFFDQAIAAKRATLEKRSQAEDAAEAQAGLRRAPRPQIAHGEGERRQGPLPAPP